MNFVKNSSGVDSDTAISGKDGHMLKMRHDKNNVMTPKNKNSF